MLIHGLHVGDAVRRQCTTTMRICCGGSTTTGVGAGDGASGRRHRRGVSTVAHGLERGPDELTVPHASTSDGGTFPFPLTILGLPVVFGVALALAADVLVHAGRVIAGGLDAELEAVALRNQLPELESIRELAKGVPTSCRPLVENVFEAFHLTHQFQERKGAGRGRLLGCVWLLDWRGWLYCVWLLGCVWLLSWRRMLGWRVGFH